MKLFNKNKKGKIFLIFAAGTILICMLLLLIISSNLSTLSQNQFGETQKAIINSLNKRDALNIYLQTSVELAKRDTFQSELAENAGHYKKIDSSDNSGEITGCGNYIYPMLSTTEGKVCAIDNEEYNLNYLELFQEQLIKYTSRNRYFIEEMFSGINFNSDKSKISGIIKEEITLIISNKEFDLDTLPLSLIKNTAVEQSIYADDVINKIKVIDLNQAGLAELAPGDCSRFINRILRIAYGLDAILGQALVSKYSELKFPGHAWGVAATYLDSAPNKIVYAGEGLKYNQLISEDNLLLPGDLLFSSSPGSWCEYTGYTEYTNTNICGYEGGGYDGNFCTQDSISHPYPIQNPFYCDFSELGVEYENFPIVTHIFMYLGDNKIANLYNFKTTSQSLQEFVNTPSKSDGVRIIIRPDYQKIEN